jgi:DNA-binding NarL/FixJ family response regulator
MSDKVKIVIVDDHEIFLKGLSMMIGTFDFAEVVMEATDGSEFLAKMDSTDFDLVLMDIKMPNLNGIDTTAKAIAKRPGIRIAALTMFGEEQYLRSMLDAGAVGFLLKSIRQAELDLAIKMMMDGRSYFSQEMMQYFTKPNISGEETRFKEELTRRELELLQLVAEGLSNQEISEKLCVSVRTVEWHKTNLLQKTNSKNIINLIITAIKANCISLV